jgi:hypothetical protein
MDKRNIAPCAIACSARGALEKHWEFLQFPGARETDALRASLQ